jgi:hypothetical protein
VLWQLFPVPKWMNKFLGLTLWHFYLLGRVLTKFLQYCTRASASKKLESYQWLTCVNIASWFTALCPCIFIGSRSNYWTYSKYCANLQTCNYCHGLPPFLFLSDRLRLIQVRELLTLRDACRIPTRSMRQSQMDFQLSPSNEVLVLSSLHCTHVYKSTYV